MTSHYNSVNIYMGSIIEAKEDEDLADNKKEAFNISHTSALTLSVKRDRINSKNHLKKGVTGSVKKHQEAERVPLGR